MSERALYEDEPRPVQRPPRADPRAVNARHAAVQTSGERLHRRRHNTDPFYVDPSLVPPGFTYQWVRREVYGQPDMTNWIGMRENHWKPVPADRHPHLAVPGETEIRRGGCVLCERPKYLTEEAAMEDLQEALDRVQTVDELVHGNRPNELPRDHPSVRKAAFVRQQYAPGDVPHRSGEEGDTISLEP